MQAVWHNTLNILQVVCYKNGTLPLADRFNLTLDSPCILMVKAGREHFELTVADPTRKLGKIHFSVNYRFEIKGQNFTSVWNETKKVSDISIDLPQGERAGESVTIRYN